jgi:5-methylcytosine-specific restriction endonuclease McrA
MYKKYNRTVLGLKFSAEKKDLVWEKGKVYPGLDKNNYRNDICGDLMKYEDYGCTLSEYGWEIDHIIPVSQLGLDSLSNLQPLQWENNRKKGDNTDWEC